MKKENLFGALLNEDKSINKDNWITPKDIVNFVEDVLTSVSEEELKSLDFNMVREKVKELGVPTLDVVSNIMRNISITTFSDFSKYVEVVKPRILFIYESSTKYPRDDEVLVIDTDVEIEFEECDIYFEIREKIKDFIIKNNIEFKKIEIFDENFVSISFATNTYVIKKLENDLDTLGYKLIEQKKVLTEMAYQKALDEVKGLYSYLIINGDFLACKTEKQYKLYKEKADYLREKRFKNLKFAIDNKPVVNTPEYIKRKPLYIAFDDAFEKAKRFVKYGEQ